MSKKSTRWTGGEDAAEEVEDVPGGTEGNTGSAPIPADAMTEQEKAATEVPGDPKQPYPTGNPPTAEEEARRARGEPREGVKAEPVEAEPERKERR